MCSKPYLLALPLTHSCVLQLTYDSFSNKTIATRLLATPRPSEPGFTDAESEGKAIKKATMDALSNLLQPNTAARKYQVREKLSHIHQPVIQWLLWRMNKSIQYSIHHLDQVLLLVFPCVETGH